MEKNDAGCQDSAAILCINNCGFFGTSATMNMCSKCHKDMILNQQQQGVNENQTVGALSSLGAQSGSAGSEPSSKEGGTRCTTCRKRVGLTGFNCRCGNVFCSVHRYSDKHDCPFDYLTASKDAIAKSNPVVKGQKLDKI